MFSSVRAFIEPETSISSRIFRGRVRRLRRPSRSTSPSLRTLSRRVRRRSANGPRRARRRRWPRRRGSRAGASRDSRRSASLVVLLRKAALDQRFGARRGKAGFVGLVGQRRLVLAASFLLQADDLFVFAVRLLDRFAAAEVEVEQPVIGRAPLRRRRERREPGLADVFQAARPEQFDGCKEGGGLLGRDRKAIGAQQRDKGDEDADGTRKCRFVAHAAASAISASSRGEMKCRSSSSFSATPIDRLNASGQRAPPL